MPPGGQEVSSGSWRSARIATKLSVGRSTSGTTHLISQRSINDEHTVSQATRSGCHLLTQGNLGGHTSGGYSLILAVDADILLYQYSCANEYEIDWGEDVVSQIMNEEQAKEELHYGVRQLLEDTGCDDILLVFSTSRKYPNFRYSVLPTYKHNRTKLVKPQLHAVLHEFCNKEFPTKQVNHLEGDDVIGILMTKYPGKYMCATIDKDLQQIPGHHFNFNKKTYKEVTEQEGDLYFYTQVLTGDSTDGYKGLPGCGPKGAEKLMQMALDACTPWADHHQLNKTRWELIVTAYEEKGLTEADALQQARVARILRASDYDFKKKKVKLWTPPK